jgi:hypothetical protein
LHGAHQLQNERDDEDTDYDDGDDRESTRLEGVPHKGYDEHFKAQEDEEDCVLDFINDAPEPIYI